MVYSSLESFPKGKSCNFCKTTTVDSITLGNIYQTRDIIVHYFCLLLASKGVQRGTDKQGLLGFLPKDIKQELQRARNIKCVYCQRRGATVICARSGCKRNFHLPCGLQNNSLHYFCREYKSLCVQHRSKNSVPVSLRATIVENKTLCIFCYSPVDVKDIFNLIWPPCCKPSSLQHKSCVQRMAYAAGYYFKCPFCANTKKFNKCMRESGIYIPEQEAVWEREPRAFSDLRIQLKCQAVSCNCPQGPSYSRNGTKWFLETCILCGGNATHLACSEIWKPGSEYSIDWQCSDCTSLVEQGRSNGNDVNSSGNPVISTCSLNEEEEEEDYCIKVGVNSSERRGRIVSYVGGEIGHIGAYDGEDLILLVNENSLNSAIKNVSNVIEIIVNKKRCMVKLKKMDNVTAGNEGININVNEVNRNVNQVVTEKKKLFKSVESSCSRSNNTEVAKDLEPNTGNEVIKELIEEKEDDNNNNNNKTLVMGDVKSRNEISSITVHTAHQQSVASELKGESIRKYELSRMEQILMEHCYSRLVIRKHAEVSLNVSSECRRQDLTVEYESYPNQGNSNDRKSNINQIQNKVTKNVDSICKNNSTFTSCQLISNNTVNNFTKITSDNSFSKSTMNLGKTELRKILLEGKYDYKSYKKLLKDGNLLDPENCNGGFKITLTKQLKQVRHLYFKPYTKTVKELPSALHSIWNYFRHNGVIKQKFLKEILSFIKGNKCIIFADNNAGIKYAYLLKSLIPHQWPVNINSRIKSNINSLLVEFCDLLDMYNNPEKFCVIFIGNACLGTDNEIDMLLKLNKIIKNTKILNLAICTIPPEQACAGFQGRMFASYNKKLIQNSEKLGFKLWDVKNIFI